MTKKPKLLWVGDIVAKTGFARVTENVLSRIKDKYDIVVLGCNYYGDPTPLRNDYVIYPASTRHQTAPFGEERIREIVQAVAPDIVFTINDTWIINNQYNQIADFHREGKFRFVGYYPIDSYGWTGGWLDTMPQWDLSICYTEFGAYELMGCGFQKAITVIPHGVTKGQFYPKDKVESRKSLGLSPDDFIVFNGNRNQFRKRIDITIAGFAEFAKDKPDTKLYLHMGQKDQGWDVMPLFGREMRRRGLDPNGRIIMTTNSFGPPDVEVDTLNTIYNAVDVGVNTCKGEGWGLVNFEHAACRVAQIVPDHTSCKEIFDGYGKLIRCDHIDVDVNYSREMPCPSHLHLAELLTSLYEDREELARTADLCYHRATEEQFDWDTVATQFDAAFQEVLAMGREEKPKALRPKRKRKKAAEKELAGVS